MGKQEKEELKEDVTLTGLEIDFLNQLINNVKEQSIVPVQGLTSQQTPLTEIHDKIREADSNIAATLMERRNERDCEVDGHEWGNPLFTEGTNIGDIVHKGCKYCPAIAYKKLVEKEPEWVIAEDSKGIGL